MNHNSKILILGSRGMVGSALKKQLSDAGYSNLLTPTRKELNLLYQAPVEDYINTQNPDVIILAAAKVGGIHANNEYRADFIYENLCIQNNTIGAALKNKNVDQFLFLGSSCIYPKNSPQPIKEEYLLTSELEPTNEPYAIAKIAGLKLIENINRQYNRNFFSVMPTNLYGHNDYFHTENSHVIPGLISRMNNAIRNNDPIFYVWGTGNPKREFLHVEDMANACIFLLESDQQLPPWINIGTGKEIKISELVSLISSKMGFKGGIEYDNSYPDGAMQKRLDVTKLSTLGWKYSIQLEDGLDLTLKYFYENYDHLRK